MSGKYPIAIDIDDRNIYAVQLRKNRKDFTIRGYWHRELENEAAAEPEKSQTLVVSLKDMTRSRQFVGKSAIVHLPSENITVFPIRFQVGRTEAMEDAMLREAVKHLTFPVEEAIIDYLSISQEPAGTPPSYKATIIAVRRDVMKQYLSITKQAGLKVEVLDCGVSSLIRLHRHLCGMADDPEILCSIGHGKSLLAIVTNETILAQRVVLWGINVIYEGILRNFELSNDKDQAINMLKRYGLAYEARPSHAGGDEPAARTIHDEDTISISRSIFQIITPYLEELVYEFHKMIGYIRSEEKNPVFKGIYMYGQAILINYLDRYLESRLNIPTKLINPLEKFSLARNIILPQASQGAPLDLTLGLAMRKVSWL